jgi:hypothetical protein
LYTYIQKSAVRVVANGAMTSESSTSTGRSTSTNSGASGNNSNWGRVRGRHGNRGRGQDRSKNNATSRLPSTFKGHTAEMHGHVFECFSEGAKKGQFTKTLEALGEYVAKNVKNPGDVMPLTHDLITLVLKSPDAIDAAQKLDALFYTLWKEEVAKYAKRKGIIQQNMKAVYAVI